MSTLKFSYKGSEALEMVQTHFPKTWENEIHDGKIFLTSLMKMYNLDNISAYNKYLQFCGSCEKAICTLAALHVMGQTVKIAREIKELQKTQLQYGDQTTALEASTTTSWKDKAMLREYYISKQNQLQLQIDALVNEMPVIGAREIKPETNVFK